jgi:hypothetical protein
MESDDDYAALAFDEDDIVADVADVADDAGFAVVDDDFVVAAVQIDELSD